MSAAALPPRSLGPEGPPGVPGGAMRTPAGPARYRAVLDSLNEVVFQTDPVGNWTYLNRAWAEITGYPVEASLGRNFMEFVHPDEREKTIALFQSVVEGGKDHCHHETRYLVADGSYRWVELRAAVLFDEYGQLAGNAGTILDITERRLAQDQLAEQAHVLELIARDKPLEETLGALALLLARHTGGSVGVSVLPAAVRDGVRNGWAGGTGALLAVGRPNGSLETSSSLRASGPEGEELHFRLKVPVHASGGTRLGTVVISHENGKLALDEAGKTLVERCAHLIAIAVERQRAGEAARHHALHDPLTGVPNRTLYQDRLQQALAATRRHGTRVGLLMLDLDHFKMVNDTLGHETGDHVLQLVSERLSGALRSSDTVCRLGGDEFVIVLPDLAGPEDAQRMARKVCAVLRDPLDLNGVKLHLEFSIGIALSTVNTDPAALLRQADVAMYRAKKGGGGAALYDPRSDEERLRGINLAGELRHAIDDDQFVVYYQPKVELRGGAVAGVEALVRWRHPTLGMVTPDMFVPLAEATAVIKPLSLWVLRTALAESRTWRDQGMDVSVAVNLSARILHDAELPDLVGEALASTGAEGRRLELEITESALMVDPERAMSAMSRLTAAGVAFTIDDFGTGYSSLSYLKRLPAHALKIDKSFVRSMDTDERDASIVRSAIELAHNLGMRVVAEGVENHTVRSLLKALRCDYVQGFHDARPMPADQIPGWLKQRAAVSR